MLAKGKAKKEGDRLFAEFLEREITPEDRRKIEMKWNIDFNGYVPADHNKIPIAFEVGANYPGNEPMDIKP